MDADSEIIENDTLWIILNVELFASIFGTHFNDLKQNYPKKVIVVHQEQ